MSEVLEFLRNDENTEEFTSLDLISYESIDSSYSGVVKAIDGNFDFGIQEIIAKINEIENLSDTIDELKSIMDYYQGKQGERAFFIENAMSHLKLPSKIKIVSNNSSRFEHAKVYVISKCEGEIKYDHINILDYFQAIQLKSSETFYTKDNE